MSDERPDDISDRPHVEPGTPAPDAGQWVSYHEDGTPIRGEYTVGEGERLPPIKGGGYWVLIDRTRHASDWHDDEADAMPETEETT